MKQLINSFWFVSGIVLCCLTTTNATFAQIVPDGTLPNNSSVTTSSNVSTIAGGTKAGSNLFHSFDAFSVPTGNTAYFNNTPDIQNIISRVTGESISNIDGLIRANGSANLFLLNPNGIVFGPDAALNIGGSFLASTANSLNFADGTQFSATAQPTSPLLIVNVPIGLQFGASAGSILNQSKAIGTDITGPEARVGLQVQPSKTLALVGGDVTLAGGLLTAEKGRIELGSVAGTSQISLEPTEKGWALGYEGVQNFKDIQLSQAATVDASGEGGGDIQVQGKRVMLTDGSQINSFTFGSEPGGTLTVNASDSVELTGSSSSLSTLTFAAGKAGDITLNTGKLTVQNQAYISTATVGATGRGGNLTVIAPVSVELTNGFLSTQTQGDGNAGDLMVETGQLIIRDGGRVSASSDEFGQGNGGNIRINASKAVNLFGVDANTGLSSALFTRTSGGGQGGNITVNTPDFRLADGAVVNALTTAQGNGGNVTVTANTFKAVNGSQVLTSTRSSGNAGNVIVNAFDSITLSGKDPTFVERIARFPLGTVDNEGSASGLFANTDLRSTGNGGDVTLKTGLLIVRDGATVSVSSQGSGDAGNLDVTAGSIRLDNDGKLTATSASGKGGGNIALQDLGLLLLRRNSEISTNAGGTGNGGNINIDADLLVALENSDITATAVRGRGGNIQINTQGIFGAETRSERTPESDITASSQLGIDGLVEINRPDVEPSSGLVALPAQLVDVSNLIAQGCPAEVGPTGSSFVITGRGGLPPNPEEALRSDTALADLGTPVKTEENGAIAAPSTNPTSSPPPTQIVEAQGWVINNYGEVVLTASVPTATPHIPWLTQASCHTPETSS